MIHLDSSNIIIPKLLDVDSSNYKVVLKNNVTNEEFILDASNNSDNDFYYSFSLDVSNLAQNEYTVTLYDDSSQCLGNYLAQKGIQTDVQRTSYENDTEYIQFD